MKYKYKNGRLKKVIGKSRSGKKIAKRLKKVIR